MKPDAHKDEGYKLMGAAFEVYNQQGAGLAEEIYPESMEMGLADRGIPFDAKRERCCYYKGRLLKRYVPDLFVSDGLLVELKALTTLPPEHEAPLMNYLQLTKRPVGYLINFGHKDILEWRRIILPEYTARVDGLAKISAN